MALKPLKDHRKKDFTFTINQKANLYLAIREKDMIKDMVPEEFTFTGE